MNSQVLNSEAVGKASGSNFISSFWFLSREKRNALTVIYAFCRLTDDIVDLASESEKESAGERLNAWRKETVKALHSQSEHPVLKELSRVVRDYRLPEAYFHKLIDGVQMDLEKRSYQTFQELYSYCYLVAGIVGLMCLGVFGASLEETKEYAVDLGVAFQLTNILRDILTDACRGRVYIPEEDLRKFSLSGRDLLSPLGLGRENRMNFEALVRFECQRAEHYYHKAQSGLNNGDRRFLVAAEVMSSVYHTILKKIDAKPSSVLEGKISLSRWETVARVLQGWARNKFSL